MAAFPHPATVALHCEMRIGEELAYVDMPIDRDLWNRSDEQTREEFRDHARRELAARIVARYQPPVTVVEPPLTMGEAVAEALAKYDAETDHFYDAPATEEH